MRSSLKLYNILIVVITLSCLPDCISFAIENTATEQNEIVRDSQLQTIANELYNLRIAAQISSNLNYRAQISIQRLRYQYDRIDNIRQALEQTSEDLEGIKADKIRNTEEISDTEAQIEQEKSEDKRAELKAQCKDLKNIITRLGLREERQREKEYQLKSDLQIELNKLAELIQKIEALEHELEVSSKGSTSGSSR